ncbi:hypothetical protein K438DRAFT_1941544 [Mycena galopus ATCC 62051]|nr:hypothetical protein K438DRAFT_1941544 [Mycena galopus ATCC 62051]
MHLRGLYVRRHEATYSYLRIDAAWEYGRQGASNRVLGAGKRELSKRGWFPPEGNEVRAGAEGTAGRQRAANSSSEGVQGAAQQEPVWHGHSAAQRGGDKRGCVRAGHHGRVRPAQRGAGYDADGGSSSGGWRAHVQHEVNVRGNQLGARNAHGAMREGAQYAAGRRGSKRQARGNKRRYPNAGGRKRRHAAGEDQRADSWADDGEGPGWRNTVLSHGADKLSEAGEAQGYHQEPEGQQQLLWKGLLQLEVQQGIATVYLTYDNGLAEGEGLEKGRKPRPALGGEVQGGLMGDETIVDSSERHQLRRRSNAKFCFLSEGGQKN